MFKHGVFASIFALLQFSSFMSFAQDMGGGAQESESSSENNQEDIQDDAGQNEDVGDVELDEGEGDAALSDEEIRAAREIIAERDRSEMLRSVEGSIKNRVPDFNMDRVVTGLKELHKSDPKLAAYYNASEAGLEMYHRDNFQNLASSDEINNGSHAGSSSDFGSVLEKAQAGDKKSQKIALAQSKA